jgi:hypothetical protein
MLFKEQVYAGWFSKVTFGEKILHAAARPGGLFVLEFRRNWLMFFSKYSKRHATGRNKKHG